MSSEVFLLAFLTPMSLPVLAGIAAVAVAQQVSEARERARLLREKEQAFFEKWRLEQEDSRQGVQRISELEESLAKAVGKLGEAGDIQAPAKATRDSGGGFIGLERKNKRRPAESSRGLFDRISGVIDSLPNEFKADKDWPFERIIEQRGKYEAMFTDEAGPGPEELLAFGETITRTLTRFLKSMEVRRASASISLEAIASLYEKASYLQGLSGANEVVSELKNIKTQLVSGRVDAGSLKGIEARLDELAKSVDLETEKRACRSVLADRLSFRLNELGYAGAEPFDSLEPDAYSAASFKGPLGGKLRVMIQPDGHLALKLDPDKITALRPREIELFRRKEKKWCLDLQELLRRLTSDGFSFRIELERTRPASSLPVATLVEAGELLDDEEEFWDDDAPRKMGLD